MWNNLPFTDLLTQVGDTIMLALGAGIFSVSTWLAFRRRHAFDRHTWMVEITDASGDASYSQPLPLSDALTLAAKYDQVGLRTDVVALPQAHHRGRWSPRVGIVLLAAWLGVMALTRCGARQCESQPVSLTQKDLFLLELMRHTGDKH